MKLRLIVMSLLAGMCALSNWNLAGAQDTLKVTKIESVNEALGGLEARNLNGRNAILSPDGSMLAYPDKDQGLCLYPYATKTLKCTAFPAAIKYPELQPLFWSPDGKYIAFTENFFRNRDDSDIWLFDVAAGTIVDRTDDQYSGTAAKAPKGTAFDSFPVWDTASGDLYFFRSEAKSDSADFTQALYRLSPASGDPTLIRDLTNDLPGSLSIYPSEFWQFQNAAVVSPDGKQMALVVRPTDPDSSAAGIWLLDLAGTTAPKQVVTLPKGFSGGFPAWEQDPPRMVEGLSWTQKGDGIVFSVAFPASSKNPHRYWRNLYYSDFKTITPLLDFTAIANEAALLRLQGDGQGYVPLVSAYLPKQNAILMFTNNSGVGTPMLYSVSLAPGTSKPVQLSEVKEFRLAPANAVNVSADGSKVLLFGYVYTLGG